MDSARRLALRALSRWQAGREFADQIIDQLLGRASLGPPDRAFALELFYGVLRNLSLLDFWIGKLRPDRLDPGTRDLLRLGLYQLFQLQTPAHAAVFETVSLAPPRARRLTNAILRRALRENSALTTAAAIQPLSIRFSHPEFLVDRWTSQFGAEATLELCQWNNRPPPIYARVNQLRTTAAEYLRKNPGSLLVPGKTNFVDRASAAGISLEGDAYIQDPSTAIACEMLQPRPGETVLDACAAPGGKSAYLAEMMANAGTLVAVDADEVRLLRLRKNLDRLGITNARIVQCNWLDEDSVRGAGFKKKSFDRILADVPCSNTGVIRRRIDVRWRLQPNDFKRMPERQLAILEQMAPLLKPAGELVYSSCSLEPDENERVIEVFLRAHPSFRLTSEERSVPFRDSFDGAFAARLHRTDAVE